MLQIEENTAMGQLALAISLEHVRFRVKAGELTEQQASDILVAAVGRFDPRFHAQLRKLIED